MSYPRTLCSVPWGGGKALDGVPSNHPKLRLDSWWYSGYSPHAGLGGAMLALLHGVACDSVSKMSIAVPDLVCMHMHSDPCEWLSVSQLRAHGSRKTIVLQVIAFPFTPGKCVIILWGPVRTFARGGF
ncbi:hypothetical protein WA026_021761 [Henosepilachna vigintioctopunctata]|uniref:Uncharacterized protein n=1 Tax=Henosepilachna vigintioctopunctata TaxID=420089 RepID=A0AAW1TYS9_9CUCU